MESCPRLLFLASFFPPLRTSGCVRAWNIARYLAQDEVGYPGGHPSPLTLAQAQGG